MRCNDCDISGLRVGIVEGNILLHGQMQGIFLFVGCRRWVFSDILARDFVFDDAKGAG